jgi:hypothetical protein
MAEVTREALEERRELLLQHRQELIDQLNATLGAIQETVHWLAKLDEPEQTDL